VLNEKCAFQRNSANPPHNVHISIPLYFPQNFADSSNFPLRLITHNLACIFRVACLVLTNPTSLFLPGGAIDTSVLPFPSLHPYLDGRWFCPLPQCINNQISSLFIRSWFLVSGFSFNFSAIS